MSLLYYAEMFAEIRKGMSPRPGGGKSPHKVLMMLAVIDLIEKGIATHNRFFLDDTLRKEFSEKLAIFGDDAKNTPNQPYVRLINHNFWHHHVKPNLLMTYNSLELDKLVSYYDDFIDYAYVDDELFEILQNKENRDYLKSVLLTNIDNAERLQILKPNDSDWDWLECEAIVADYFDILIKEIRNEPYSKTEHRNMLLQKLSERSRGSIEFKHQNISAVLVELGYPYIDGYKPAFNYQQKLKQVVWSYVASNVSVLEDISKTAEDDVDPLPVDWGSILDTDMPERIPTVEKQPREFLARKQNYSQREQNNRRLGEKGEAFVIEFEKYRLNACGKTSLAKEVKWSSKEEGDGLGYDIRSFDEQENQVFIEVKTTKQSKYAPFFISENELAFSQEYENQYMLYRLYNFGKHERIFIIQGAVDKALNLTPQIYRASFK